MKPTINSRLKGCLPFAQWASAFADDQTCAAALLYRLLHHAHIVQIRGDSYRLKDKRKPGQVKRRAVASGYKIASNTASGPV